MSTDQWEDLGKVTLNQTGVLFSMKLKSAKKDIVYDENLMKYINIYQERRIKSISNSGAKIETDIKEEI